VARAAGALMMDASGAPDWAARMQARRPIMWLGFMTVPRWLVRCRRAVVRSGSTVGRGRGGHHAGSPTEQPARKVTEIRAVLSPLLAEAASLSPRSVSDVK
jgi:hypothetical protein